MTAVWDAVWPYLAASLPTIGVAFLFYWVVRYMIQADRSERQALARWNLDHGRDAKTSPEVAARSAGANNDGVRCAEKELTAADADATDRTEQ